MSMASATDQGLNQDNKIDQGAKSTAETHRKQESDVDGLCEQMAKHTLEDSEVCSVGDKTHKKMKTQHLSDKSDIYFKTFCLKQESINAGIAKYFLSSLFEKYTDKGVKFAFKDKSICFEGPQQHGNAFEMEFTNSLCKLEKTIMSDSLDVSKSGEGDIGFDTKMYDKYGVFVEYDRNKRSVNLYGINWDDIQAVMQSIKKSLGPDFVHSKQNTDDGSPQDHQSKRAFPELSHNQGARPKTSKSAVPSGNETNSVKGESKKIYSIHKIKVKVYNGDILNLPVSCIVNAANGNLQHHGGVARVIANAAGKGFWTESKRYISTYGKLRVGEACTTSAGDLPYDHVIHTVGPCWSNYKPHGLVRHQQFNFNTR